MINSSSPMSDLSRDLLEEIFFRVPVKCTRAVRSTCKNWNSLFNDQGFTEKLFGKAIVAKENEFLVVMMLDRKVYLMSVNLHGIQKYDDNNGKSFIKQKAKLISLKDDADDGVDNISEVFHCEGLLLLVCFTINGVRLVVWNPYCGQTRWITPINAYKICDSWYALGYEKKNNNSLHSHKILRCDVDIASKPEIYEIEIYNFNSNSWKFFYLPRDWDILFNQLGVSLEGNT